MVADLALTELDRLHERIAPHFARTKPRARVRAYVARAGGKSGAQERLDTEPFSVAA